MPGVQTIHAIAEGAPPAAETTEAVRSLPAAEVDALVDSDTADMPPRNRR
jgi:hypothetical protein